MNEKKIQDAINTVEPEVGAKERMYQNIIKKAAKSKVQKKKSVWIVRYALPVVACFCLVVIGSSRILPILSGMIENKNVQSDNPFVEVQSAEDFKSIGISLDAPVGAQNVEYTIIDNEIADINFDMNGTNYTIRASAQTGDFSGLYGKEEKIETIDAARNAVLSVVQIESNKYYKVIWTDGKINYCLYGTDGVDKTQIKFIYEAIKS